MILNRFSISEPIGWRTHYCSMDVWVASRSLLASMIGEHDKALNLAQIENAYLLDASSGSSNRTRMRVYWNEVC